MTEKKADDKRPAKKTPAAKKSTAKAPAKPAAKSQKQDRLAPGELDKLVLGYMRRHKEDGPCTPSAVAKGIKRSSGAVANCLARQEKQKKVRLVNPKPRRYELVDAKKG